MDAAEEVWRWVGPGYPDLDDPDERKRFMGAVTDLAAAWFITADCESREAGE